jgi:hypothetical protein
MQMSYDKNFLYLGVNDAKPRLQKFCLQSLEIVKSCKPDRPIKAIVVPPNREFFYTIEEDKLGKQDGLVCWSSVRMVQLGQILPEYRI